MKYIALPVIIVCSAVVSTYAAASGSADGQRSGADRALDIYKVTSVTTRQDPEKVDGLVKSRMVYQDRAGQIHTLEYTTMGYGRQGG